ncbi:hypothetical protein DL89DRAFT_290852 [Linderina pennispora]|uniref:intramembrane prenyl-peptidase Rce1 n=1 Tax=Linderina pennispora TaxID=61395 RepID=A0A1Y1WHN9_9FUNG|nr:uncharacterized protein DL89DRAFT_290852 [Linderina pennispora]ORX73090.1 hypothetical protein DL89DRAFT_290852 [Linderina pennispora]
MNVAERIDMEHPSSLAAVLVSIAHGSLYVFCIYMVSALFAAPGVSIHDRDHPRIIRLRICGATLATVLSLVLTAFLLSVWQQPTKEGQAQWNAVELLGLSIRDAGASVVVALVLTTALYLGPLVLDKLDGAFRSESLKRIPEAMRQPSSIRNYIVGPITEELVFRSAVLALWTAADIDTNRRVFLSPLIFGVAHVHHAITSYRSGSPLSAVALSTCFQFAYTTLFGWYAVFLYVRSKSVVGPIVAHSFCNIQGLPDEL